MVFRPEVRHLGLDDVSYGEHCNDLAFVEDRQMPDPVFDHDRRHITKVVIGLCDNEVRAHDFGDLDVLEVAIGLSGPAFENIPLGKHPYRLFAVHNDQRPDLVFDQLAYRVCDGPALVVEKICLLIVPNISLTVAISIPPALSAVSKSYSPV